jgi:hypothetical protein
MNMVSSSGGECQARTYAKALDISEGAVHAAAPKNSNLRRHSLRSPEPKRIPFPALPAQARWCRELRQPLTRYLTRSQGPLFT